VVTHQLQAERRTAKARRPRTDVLPLKHATNRPFGHNYTNVTDKQTDRTTDRLHMANRFTNGSPKTVIFDISFVVICCQNYVKFEAILIILLLL